MASTHPPGSLPEGHALIEFLIIVGVVALVLATAGPWWNRGSGLEPVTTDGLEDVLIAELAYHGKYGEFTGDRAALLGLDPTLPLGQSGRPGSVYIVVGHSRFRPAVCLFASSEEFGWNTLYYSGARDAMLRLGSPNDCIRVMLDEQQGIEPARGKMWLGRPGDGGS